MAPSDSEAQFKFLIACIKYSTAGKIDFAQVATECDIVTKGAAAKRYERLMKAHGITGNNNGARAGSAGPSEPSTPTPRKALPGNRASSSKKRKLAARGSDLDDNIKAEVKSEVKQELLTSDNTDGPYIAYPIEPHEVTTNALVMSGESCKGESTYSDDEVLMALSRQTEYGGSAAPMTFVHQMLMSPSPDSSYGFIDSTCDLQLSSSTSHPFSHEHDTDNSTQTLISSDAAVAHWLHHRQATSSSWQ